MKKRIDLSVILVNWNCGNVIINCIDSLIKTIKKHSYEIIVVDNNSKDGTPELIKKKYPKIKLIKNNFNNMFAGANNQGFEASSGDYIFILNSDTIVTKDAIDKLLDYMKKNKQEVITCTLLNKDGSIQYNMHRSFPSYIKILFFFLYNKFKFISFLHYIKNYLLLNNKFNKDFYLEQAAGAAILISRRLINDLGYLFDEKRFPLLYNDVDLCYRIYKKGINILCKTDIYIYHLKGNSIKKLNFYKFGINYGISSMNFFKKYNFKLDYFMLKISIKPIYLFWYILAYINYLMGFIKFNELTLRKIEMNMIIKESFNLSRSN